MNEEHTREREKEIKKQTIENTLDDEQNRGNQAEDAKNGSGTTGRCADHCARWGESLCDTNEGENDTTKRKVTHSQRKKREEKQRKKKESSQLHVLFATNTVHTQQRGSTKKGRITTTHQEYG